MKYFIIAGEASGDLHASHLMKAIKRQDADAAFTFCGGDLMSLVGGVRLLHYRDMAFMGFMPVLLHLPTILRNLHKCKKYIITVQPDVVILVDYPGFNLRIAEFVKRHSDIPIYYYISPKIWAWKEHRIKSIKKYVDALFSILPFEVPFYEQKHSYPIHYVGNPTAEEVADYKSKHQVAHDAFVQEINAETSRRIIAILAGSRKQEIKDNLRLMLSAALPLTEHGYHIVISCAPGIDEDYYLTALGISMPKHVSLFHGSTYRLLSHSFSSLVTSGTATLEAALFRVPQVVCYYTPMGRLVSLLRRKLLKVPYVSLVNLTAGREVVPELVADGMTIDSILTHLFAITTDEECRRDMLAGYSEVANKLGGYRCSETAASLITQMLRKS